MIVSRDREKLIQAIIFFCKHTKNCRTLKLFKLLNLLDQEHFRQTGRTVTGLNYSAWKQGPVPPSLWREISKTPGDDLSKAITIRSGRDLQTNNVNWRSLTPKVPFNQKLFTKREISIMNRLSQLFDDSLSDDMSELSHMKGLPWRKVWANGAGDGKDIPHELSLKAAPLMEDETISENELTYRRELFAGLR